MGVALSTVDPYVIREISKWLWDIELVDARASCKRLRRAICVPKRRSYSALFTEGIKHNGPRLCEWAIKKMTMVDQAAFLAHRVSMLRGIYGEEKLGSWVCKFLDVPLNTIYASTMAFSAAMAGREDWCLKSVIAYPDYRADLIEGAIQGGHRHLLDQLLPIEPQAFTSNHIMHIGIFGGHEEMCLYAKELGCDNWNSMAFWSSCYDSKKLLNMAIEWGANDFSLVVAGGLHNSNVEPCLIGLDRGGKLDVEFSSNEDIRFYELVAHYGGLSNFIGHILHNSIVYDSDKMEKFITWGRQHGLLKQEDIAAISEQILAHADRQLIMKLNLCHLAKSLGASDFNALMESKNPEFVSLAREWSGTIEK
jgi:hypothetical protein